MKKNGFTLIELLAVIVILAIIALITVPVVLSAIGTARSGAAKESARNFVSAAEFYCAQELLKGTAVTTINSGVTSFAASYKGNTPTGAYSVTLDAGTCKASAASLTFNGTAYTLGDL